MQSFVTPLDNPNGDAGKLVRSSAVPPADGPAPSTSPVIGPLLVRHGTGSSFFLDHQSVEPCSTLSITTRTRGSIVVDGNGYQQTRRTSHSPATTTKALRTGIFDA
jgi:hypothetical protein